MSDCFCTEQAMELVHMKTGESTEMRNEGRDVRASLGLHSKRLCLT